MLCLLHPFGIFARVGVDTDDIAFVDEKRDVHLGTGREGRELGAARDGVALHCWRSFFHHEVDFHRDLDRHRLFLVGENLDDGVRGEPLHLVMDSIGGEGETVLRVALLSEPTLLVIAVEIDRVHPLRLRFFGGLVGVEGDLEHLAGHEVPQFCLVHRLALLHAEDMRREHLIGRATIGDNRLREDFVVGEDSHDCETKDG